MHKTLISLLTLLIAGLLIVLQPAGLTADQALAAALIMSALVFWAVSILPDHLTALIFMLAAILLSIAPPEKVFAGFSSTAMWLIFSGLVFSMAFNVTGLDRRLSDYLGNHVNGSYVKLISGVVIISVLTGFLMPSSMGRAVLLVPIAMVIADSCGFLPGSKGRTGVALAAAFGCHVPTFAVLPANVPNMVLIGSAETIHGVSFSYTEYLLLHFPVLGILKTLLIIVLLLLLFPDKPTARSATTADALSDPTKAAQQRRLMWVLGIALLFWFTDSIHHISPAWVGLAAAVFLLLPRVGLVDNKTFNDKMNFSLMVFIAGILALGTLISSTGLGQVLASAINGLLPLTPGEDLLNYAALSATSILTALVATLPGVPAVLTPFADQMAAASGLSLKAILMTQVIGFSTLLMPYQSGPMLVALKLSGESLKRATQFCLAQGILSIVLLLPLNFLWWQCLQWL